MEFTMTPLADAQSPFSAVETRAQALQERQATTDSILTERASSRSICERRRLQQEAVLLNLHLADRIAARYVGRGIDRDDLIQVARMGLVKAVRGYRVGKGAGFTAYATPTIAGEIKRYFRDHGWMVRPPRRLQELHGELSSVEPDLQQRLHRAPSADDLAGALGVKVRELSDALVARSGYTALSLDAPARSGLSLGDGLPDDDDPFEAVERAEWLRPALSGLTDRERRVIRLRFFDGLTQEQIGHHLGVSQMQVSRLLAGILGRLRDKLGLPETAAIA
jgi:RNA polymerase sigma-B factor